MANMWLTCGERAVNAGCRPHAPSPPYHGWIEDSPSCPTGHRTHLVYLDISTWKKFLGPTMVSNTLCSAVHISVSQNTFMSAKTDARKLRNTPFVSYWTWSPLLKNTPSDPFQKNLTSSQERQSGRRLKRQKLWFFFKLCWNYTPI